MSESVTETKLVAKIVPADDDMGYVALTATKQQAETFDLIDYTLSDEEIARNLAE